MTDRIVGSDSQQLRRHSDLILAAAGDGVYGLDTEGRTTFVNPAAARMSGFEPEEMIGIGQHGLIHHSRADGTAYPRSECPIYAAFKDGKVHHVSDEVFWRKDGTSYPVEYVSTPMLEDGVIVGAVVSFRDITKRRQAEDALRESEERYRRIFDASYDAIFLLAADDGSILDVNEEACRMLGFSRDELMAMSGYDLHPGEVKELEVFWAKVRERGRWKTEKLSCLTVGGEAIPAQLSASTIISEGRDCILVIAHDMRRRVQAESRVRKLQSDLHHVSRLSAMGEMASGMAHELNQPLTAVMNYVQASRRILESAGGGAPDNVAEYMDKAVAQASRAGEIIRGLRKFVEKGEPERTFENMNEIVEEASRLALAGSAAEHIAFKTSLVDDLPFVLVDKIQIQQVVFNLVRNAVEALAESEERKVTVETNPAVEGAVEVTVCDNGPGLAEEISGRLFQSFVTTKPEGMGVGLSICRSIVEDHGGRLWAEPNRDRGMTFRFTLPMSPRDDEDLE